MEVDGGVGRQGREAGGFAGHEGLGFAEFEGVGHFGRHGAAGDQEGSFAFGAPGAGGGEALHAGEVDGFPQGVVDDADGEAGGRMRGEVAHVHETGGGGGVGTAGLAPVVGAVREEGHEAV